MEKFQELRVWQEAKSLVVFVYKCTKAFPPEERFGLISQMRRATVSVAANIAEGSKKRSVRDRRRFHEMAETSLEELKSHALIASELGFFSSAKDSGAIIEHGRRVGRMLARLTATIRD